MHLRNHKVVLALVLTAALVLGLAGTAFASWSDLTASILGDYGITESEVAQISDGYTDGSWKPYADMQRRQFVKMADDAYVITLVSPATPTYTDVPASDEYYPFVEGATAAGLINGVGGGLFAPLDTITREQAIAIIARYVAGDNGYDLDSYYADPEAEYASFAHGGDVSGSLVEEMAFAVDFGIVEGNAFGDLDPQGTMSRIQGAAMLIRSWGIVPEEEPAATTTTTTEPAATTTTTTGPVVDSVTLSPESGVNTQGDDHTVTATVLDQFGEPMQDVTVDFTWSLDVSDNASATEDFTSSATTGSNGKITSTWTGASEWGHAEITASVGSVDSNTVTKYWALQVASIEWLDTNIIIPAGLGNDGSEYNIRLNGPKGNIIVTGTYSDAVVSPTSNTKDVDGATSLWIEFVGAGDTDGDPNWVYDDDSSETPVGVTKVVDSITLSPTGVVNFTYSAGPADHTVTATLDDQFGDLYTQDATVTFTWQQVEDATVSFTADVTTNTGVASYTPIDASVAAGAWDITAEADGETSTAATKYWASTDATINATANDVTVAAGLASDYDFRDFDVVVMNNDGDPVVIGSGTYGNSGGTNVSTTYTFTSGEEVFIDFPFSTREDGLFDWFCATATTP